MRELLKYFWCKGLRTGIGVMAVELHRGVELRKHYRQFGSRLNWGAERLTHDR